MEAASSSSLEKHDIKRDHVSIEITNEDNLVSSIKQKMECISLSHYTNRIPQQFFRGNEEKYYPSLVSIGPFHHGNAILRVMEGKKWRYFNTLLSRKPNNEAILKNCVDALRHMEQKARKFYGETINMESDRFVEIMLLDGCFIIELFLENGIRSLRRRDDPLFSANNKVFKLRCDLILLENQIPFLVLEQLFLLVPIPKQCNFSFTELALFFFQKMIPGEILLEKPSPETHHLLDLIRQYYLPTSPEIISSGGKHQKNVHSASYLRSVGIKIEKGGTECPLNLSFFNGELEIPTLKIHGYTEILFRNLVAMEFLQPECSEHVSSYVFLMERLVRSKKDVGLLQNKGILIDGNEKKGEIDVLFKRVQSHVDINVNEFYYKGLIEQINEHKTRKTQVWGII